VSICPHCQAENESGATICQTCGKPLATAASSEGLPLWLQALNPEGRAEDAEDTVVAQAHTPHPEDGAKAAAATNEAESHQEEPAQPTAEAQEIDTIVAQAEAVPSAAPAPTTGGDQDETTPSFAMPTPQAKGTDTVIATQPIAATRSNSPTPAAAPTNETASLINEDDLPAWLRAFSEPERNTTTAADDDQSWMLGSSVTITEEQEASDLAQSWQAPPRATAVERTSAAAIFAVPATNPTKVTKHERLITPMAPPPVATKPIEMSSPGANAKSGAAPGVPVRLGAGRPIPASTARVSSSVQRTAIIAFLAALIIFLVVLAIFVVAPALRG
jgi:hypothetical protein